MAKIKIDSFNLNLNKSRKNFCITGVWSVKGGVGKTTMSIAIAHALSEHKTTGLLDADITSPNIASYLNIKEEVVGDKKRNIIYTKKKDNMEIISMGSIIKNKAVVWRGVMLSKAFEDFLNRVEWKAEHLIIDFPPGTSDILLDMPEIGIDNLILVTTPSKLSLNELERSIEFIKKFGIKINGIIENMVSDVYHSIKEEIEERFSIEVIASFDYNKKTANAIEQGKSIHTLYPEKFKNIIKKLKCSKEKDLNKK